MITSGKLTEIYNRWGDKNNLQPLGSADEELYRNDLKPNQYKWLIKFIKIWDITTNTEELMTKRNHYLLEITKWTMEELESEVDGYKQLGGVGVKDTIRKNEAEDELNWRNEKGYYGLTPKEIQEEEIEKYGDVNQGLGTWNGYEYVKNK